MKVKILVTALFALFSLAAFAGLHAPVALLIDLDNRFAQGDMLTAANSVNSDELIGCGVRSFDGGYRFGFCQASDDDGNSVACFTEDNTLVDTIQGIADHSYIQFSWDDDGADNLTCTAIGVSTQSFYIDKIKN
jgi:hypothetical protein